MFDVNFISSYYMKHQINKSNRTCTSFFTPRMKAKSKEKEGDKTGRNKSLNLKLNIQQVNSFNPGNPEVYFNKNKRKVYLHSLVDQYFTEQKQDKQIVNMESVRSSRKSINRKDVFSSQCKKRKHKEQPSFVGVAPAAKPLLFNLSSVENTEDLPVISQINYKKRPISEHHTRRSGNIKKYEHEDSLFNDSTRSVYGVQSQ